MTILFAILLFSILIFVHELGHFLAAKASGVQVNEFAMFMGPALIKWGKGETQYSIRCIPIGGYCAMEGEDEDTDNPRSFQKAAWWKRLGILLAGAAMNFVSGFLIFALVLAPADGFAQPVIAEAEQGNTIVYEEGLHLGDRILKIDGNRVFVASDATMLFNLNDGQTHDIVVKRNGQKVELQNFAMERHAFSNDDGSTSMRYGIRFGYAENTFGSLISYTWNNCLSVVQSVKLSLQMLLSGQAGLSDMAGPVGIVSQMSEIAAESETTKIAFLNLLSVGAFIAINLAVMNLLPIPALDGGKILFLLIELVRGKKLDPKYEGVASMIGLGLILALFVFVTYHDILRIVG